MKQSLKEASFDNDMDAVRFLAAQRLKISSSEISSIRILKRSVDARDKRDVLLIYSAEVEAPGENNTSKYRRIKDAVLIGEQEELGNTQKELVYGTGKIENRPIIIGSGPAGLFAGLILAQHGYRPLILERGNDVDKRTEAVDTLFKLGVFDENSNIQFGEGGAGTFSDGKLTTRIKDKRIGMVLSMFVEGGAPEEIMYLAKPHIGTDILKTVIKNIRNRIIELGGEVRFSAKVTNILQDKGAARAVVVNGSEIIESNVIIAALGHSARDTYAMLFERGVRIIPKPFSIGVRIEHRQSMIDEAQYGSFAGHPRLGAADYILTARSRTTGRAAYSFCMCPGGQVVAAASEQGMLVTNGMSEYMRNRENANSALVVSVSPEDFGSAHPLSGVEFQRTWEGKAYALGGRNYHAPVQLVGDFLSGNPAGAVEIAGVDPGQLAPHPQRAEAAADQDRRDDTRGDGRRPGPPAGTGSLCEGARHRGVDQLRAGDGGLHGHGGRATVRCLCEYRRERDQARESGAGGRHSAGKGDRRRQEMLSGYGRG
jgi:uncharacterized FAD-dependent dehydrogenase